MNSFFDDFRAIADLSEEQQEEVIKFLNQKKPSLHQSFIENESFADQCSSAYETTKSTIRVLTFLIDSVIQERGIAQAIYDLEDSLGRQFKKDEKLLKAWEISKRCLPRLGAFILVRKQIKQKSSAPHMHGISFLCDARPVFNLERTNIELFTYPILLRLVDDNDNKMTLEIDENDLSNIIKEAQAALEKLKMLKQFEHTKNAG